MQPIPQSAQVFQQLRRTAWRYLPDVIIHSEESAVKKHPVYATAKCGEPSAARELVLETMTLNGLAHINSLLNQRKPVLLAVQAFETEGMNVIPRVLATALARELALPLTSGIVQINRVSHTGSSGYHRLAYPALFAGTVEEREYFLVDDFIGQGGTLANLKGFIESHGGMVLGATTLTGKQYSAKLCLADETLQTLRRKHGTELEQWWLAAFGYGFERLTESEARYLISGDDAHTITARIVAAWGAGT